MQQGWGHANRANKIRFTCRTQNHWIEGSINTANRRLVDFLNGDNAREVVAVEDASVLIFQDGKTTRISLGHTNISPATILLAIPLEDAPRQPDVAMRAARVAERRLAGIGPFHVMGDVYLSKDARGRGVLEATDQRFIVLADAVITHVHDHTFVRRFQAVCVNRQRVEFIGTVLPSE